MTPVTDTHLVQPARVRAARDLRELTQAEVCSLMSKSITPAALSQIEAGKVRPSPETLSDLAGALKFPVEFFTAQWQDSRSEGALLEAVQFRDLAGTPIRQRRRAAVLALLVSDLVSALEQYVRLPELSIPDYRVAREAPREEIEEIAQAVRGEWDLGDEPVGHVVREVESRGVPVARVRLGSDKVDAFNVLFASRPIIMLALDKSNFVRSRFDTSHELGHLLLHERAGSHDRTIERQAHDFAASFLLPAHIAREVLPTRMDAAGWGRLAQLKRQWGISMAALLYRSRELKVITSDRYLSAVKYMSSQGWRSLEPGDREMGPPEAPTLIERALATVESEEGLARAELIHSAHLPVDDVDAILRSAVDSRPRVTA